MDIKKEIISIGNQNNGYIVLDNLKDKKIKGEYFRLLEKDGIINRVAHGIYLLSNYQEDEFYTIHMRYKKAIFSRRTALLLNNMTNRQLDVIDANFPSNYNTENIITIKCHRICKNRLLLGHEEKLSPYGNMITTYNKERCICDLFLYDDFDNEEKSYAIKKYKEFGVDYDKLFDYAEKLGVLVQVKSIFEVL